jgi:predicted phage baseplate assembly protein
MTQACHCCEGPLVLTPAATANRPGLNAIVYRVGTHATFLQTMQARLSSKGFPALQMLRTREPSDAAMAMLDAWATVADVLTFYQERIAKEGYLRTATERRSLVELARLVGYAPRPGVAASVYLAYTLDKDSAPVEIPKGALANSVPAPGEKMQGFEASEPLQARVEFNAMKPRMTRPQTFADILEIERGGLYLKGTGTKLKPNDPLIIKVNKDAQPNLVYIEAVTPDADNDRTRVMLQKLRQTQLPLGAARAVIAQFIRVEGFEVSADSAMATRVIQLLEWIGNATSSLASLSGALAPAVEQLAGEAADARDKHYTKLLPWIEQIIAELSAINEVVEAELNQNVTGRSGGSVSSSGRLAAVVEQLKTPPTIPPASARQMPRSANIALAPRANSVPQLLVALQPALSSTLFPALQNLPSASAPQLEVYALPVVAAPFGHNAPLRLIGFAGEPKLPVMAEWNVYDPLNEIREVTGEHHEPGVIFLDNEYEIPYPPPSSSRSNCFVVVDRPSAVKREADINPVAAPAPPEQDLPRRILLAELKAAPMHRSLHAYGLSGKTVRLRLPDKLIETGSLQSSDAPTGWISGPEEFFSVVRGTRVYAGSVPLELVEAPITGDIEGCEIELAELFDGLQPGRWLIVAGERTDIKSGDVTVPGIMAAELVMIERVEQRSLAADDIQRPGDKLHTFVGLATCLAYNYKRDSVIVYGNVVKATHGETRREVLGSGDASKAFQKFALKQSPLTFVSAPTVSGVASTLEVRVNDVLWHETDMLAGLGPRDRRFLSRTDDDQTTTIVFGDGVHARRLPTGVENIRATYRSGIGQSGNVKCGQISLLGTRPLGVKEVMNPIRASGGADRETRDEVRKNAPLALIALDRLVATSDYAAFSLTFAGIGKAAAFRNTDGHQQWVHVAVAGARDIPIETTSDLYRNLKQALHRFGDPYLPIEVKVRDRSALVVSANIKVDPDYQWEMLEPKIRAAMLDRFSFERMDLGQDALLSDAVRAIQTLRGVVYVDVDVFDSVSEQTLLTGFSQSTPQTLDLLARVGAAPDEIIYLAPEVPDTLILQEVKS